MLQLLTGLLTLASPSAHAFVASDVVVRELTIVHLKHQESQLTQEPYVIPGVSDPELPSNAKMAQNQKFAATVACVQMPQVIADLQRQAFQEMWKSDKLIKMLRALSRVQTVSDDSVRIEIGPGESIVLGKQMFDCERPQ